MTCKDVLDFLMMYLDSELPPKEREQFERHLRVCTSCVNYLESYRATVRAGKRAMQVGDSDPAEACVPPGLIKAIREARLKAQ